MVGSFSKTKYNEIKSNLKKINEQSVRVSSGQKIPIKSKEKTNQTDENSLNIQESFDTIFEQNIKEFETLIRTTGIRPKRENDLLNQLDLLKQQIQSSINEAQENYHAQSNLNEEVINQIEQSCEAKINTMETNHSNALNQLKEKNHNKVEQLRSAALQEKEDLIRQHEELINKLKTDFEDKLIFQRERFDRWKKEYEQQVGQMIELHREQNQINDRQDITELLERIEKEYKSVLDEQTMEINKLTNEKKELHDILEQATKTIDAMKKEMDQQKEIIKQNEKKMIQTLADAKHYQGLYDNLMIAFETQQKEYSNRISALQAEFQHEQEQYEIRKKRLLKEKNEEMDQLHLRIKEIIDKKMIIEENLHNQLTQMTQRAQLAEETLDELQQQME